MFPEKGNFMTEPVTIPKGMNLIQIPTTDGTIELYGRLLGVVDNERRGRPRWAEIELLEYVDTDTAHISENPDLNTYGQQLYLLHTMGHSVVYHRHDADCNKGVAVYRADFPFRAEFPVEDLEPCEECQPPYLENITPDTMMNLEVLRHLIYKCKSAEVVLEKLRRPSRVTCPQCYGVGSYPKFTRQVCNQCNAKGYVAGPPTLSSPGQRLVEIAKWKDPAIRAAVSRPVRL